AVSVMKKRGLNLHNHQSHSITERSLRQADLILAMTGSHRSAIVERIPELSSKVHLISGGNSDVSDPFGGDESGYEVCADELTQYLRTWLNMFEESWFPDWQGEVN